MWREEEVEGNGWWMQRGGVGRRGGGSGRCREGEGRWVWRGRWRLREVEEGG